MKTKKLEIDGKEIETTYLGKGLFCKAYRAQEKVFLLCQGDYSKEGLALFVDQSLTHIPTIERHEDLGDYQVFSMPYYHKLSKKEFPRAYAQWKKLPNTLAGPTEIEAFINKLRNEGEESLATALSALYDAFQNYCYSTMLMEFQKVNVSVDNQGELILRDCLASRESIREKRNEQEKRRQERKNRYAF